MSVSGMGTTYNLPNYTGELYQVSPTDTPLLSAIGGMSSGKTATSTEFEWQTVGIRSTSAGNTQLEGADAPTANEQARSNVTNVVEIHQSQVSVSYTKQAAVGLKSGTNNDLTNPIQDERSFQIQQELMAMAVDIEQSFTNGTYAKPANNSTARKTRGILSAITTNVFANGGTARAVSKSIIDNALSDMFANGAPLRQATTVFLAGPSQKIALSNLYATAVLNQPTMTRNVGGVAIDTIVTDFGTFGVMVSRYMPAGKIGVIDLAELHPVWLNIPGKGAGLFAEPLAKTGAADNYQLYGEVGLEYGPEQWHGLISDLS